MFKKTEETEWTRFSKALSSRERDETESPVEPEAAAVSTAPAQPTTAMSRQGTSDVNVSARTAARPQAVEAAEEIESTIGEHTSVEGTFKSENSIRVRGSVQGEIESQRAILIDEQANVTAKVTAESITVAGQVNGQIFCTGRIEIRPSGRVIGEINAGTLIMQEGAFFEGHLKMGGRGATASSEPVSAKR